MLSIEATEALEKIKLSFDSIGRNSTLIVGKKESAEKVKLIEELSTKLNVLGGFVALNKSEIKMMQESVILQRSEGESFKSLCASRQAENLTILEETKELLQASIRLSSNAGEGLMDRKFADFRSDLSGLKQEKDSEIITLRIDLHSVNEMYEEQKKRNAELAAQLAVLSEKFEVLIATPKPPSKIEESNTPFILVLNYLKVGHRSCILN